MLLLALHWCARANTDLPSIPELRTVPLFLPEFFEGFIVDSPDEALERLAHTEKRICAELATSSPCFSQA
jgi:hypothetical protein